MIAWVVMFCEVRGCVGHDCVQMLGRSVADDANLCGVRKMWGVLRCAGPTRGIARGGGVTQGGGGAGVSNL